MIKNKINLNDFGRLVKPRILTEAFLLCNFDHIDLHSWWKQVLILDLFSNSYKKDTIVSNYGLKLHDLFGNLEINDYVAKIKSFIILHDGKYKLINSLEEANQYVSKKRKFFIRSVGIEIYKSYDKETKQVGELWNPNSSNNITWFYKVSHIIPIEDVEQYNNIELGDLILFDKTQAIVTNIKTLKRKKFYNTCSWTNKKITILSGVKAYQVRLGLTRDFKIIKPNNS